LAKLGCKKGQGAHPERNAAYAPPLCNTGTLNKGKEENNVDNPGKGFVSQHKKKGESERG